MRRQYEDVFIHDSVSETLRKLSLLKTAGDIKTKIKKQLEGLTKKEFDQLEELSRKTENKTCQEAYVERNKIQFASKKMLLLERLNTVEGDDLYDKFEILIKQNRI